MYIDLGICTPTSLTGLVLSSLHALVAEKYLPLRIFRVSSFVSQKLDYVIALNVLLFTAFYARTELHDVRIYHNHI
jgi:hypothetical protein